MTAIDARLDPAAALAAVTEALAEPEVQRPVIALPADGTVRLPGGFLPDLGNPAGAITEATVKELTGADEEEIVRARKGSEFRLLQTILERGVDRIGSLAPSAADLKRMLLGDREALLLAISKATYDAPLEYEKFPCSTCGELVDVSLGLEEIPVKVLDKSEDRLFEVALRRGRKATVSLPTGEDQEAIFDLVDRANTAEINTALLTRCVRALTEADGTLVRVAQNPVLIRGLGLADRQKILTEITERQPGPQYDKASFVHDACGKEVFLPVGRGDLFPGL